MNNPADILRRRLVLGLAALPVSGLAAVRTPSASEGPFYPIGDMRFDDVDNDLVKIDGRVQAAGGEIVRLQGRVLNTAGQPIPGALVEIWQCDVKGRYLHSGDGGGPRDPGFQGIGQSMTDADGNYWFRTIKPVPYTGRTPHIHVKVWVAGRDSLTTQFYLPDHPHNALDWLFRNLPDDRLEPVLMRFENNGAEPTAILDIVV